MKADAEGLERRVEADHDEEDDRHGEKDPGVDRLLGLDREPVGKAHRLRSTPSQAFLRTPPPVGGGPCGRHGNVKLRG